MNVCYNKLFKLLIDKNMKKTEFSKATGISVNTLAKLSKNGKFDKTGLGSDRECKEAVSTAFNYLKANAKRISGAISTTTKDYIINYQVLQGIGMMDKLTLPTLIALCSIALGEPTLANLAIIGDITISSTMIKVDELANTLQVCLDSGAKNVLIPSISFTIFQLFQQS